MTVAVKLAGFGVGLLAAFGAAFGIGRAVGPVGADRGDSPPAQTTTTMVMDHGTHP